MPVTRHPVPPAIGRVPPVAEFELSAAPASKADAVALFVFSDSVDSIGELAGLSAEIRASVSAAMKSGDVKGKAGTAQVIGGAIGLRRIILLGLGKRAEFPQDAADLIRWAGAASVKAARELKLQSVIVHPGCLINHDATPTWESLAPRFAEGLVLGGFSFKVYKSGKTTGPDNVAASADRVIKVQLAHVSPGPENEIALTTQLQIATAANYARHLACHPANTVNPATLCDEARKLARQFNLKCTIINAAQAARLGMGGLLAVGMGSRTPPAMILLEYNPSSSGKRQDPIVVVGKAVTFDTGGISIKPAADMGAMKYDKCGGMAVMGIMRAISCIGLNQRVIGIIPTAENSVDAAAYRPGDIIRMYNGKTVDVTNTDAEGRMILADALAYACEKYRPRAVVDMATLTGGVVTALGSVYAGLMSNQDEIAAALVIAGQQTGEWLWRLPLHPRYAKLLESPHADFTNSGGREAHPIQGGMFLNEFVPGEIPWAHLDIAGLAHPRKEHRYLSADNASGFGVRLLVEFLQSLPG